MQSSGPSLFYLSPRSTFDAVGNFHSRGHCNDRGCRPRAGRRQTTRFRPSRTAGSADHCSFPIQAARVPAQTLGLERPVACAAAHGSSCHLWSRRSPVDLGGATRERRLPLASAGAVIASRIPDHGIGAGLAPHTRRFVWSSLFVRTDGRDETLVVRARWLVARLDWHTLALLSLILLMAATRQSSGWPRPLRANDACCCCCCRCSA